VRKEQRIMQSLCFCSYIDVVLNPDEVASPQVGGRQRRHIELLVQPLVFFSRLDFASGEGGQLPGFRLHDFAPGQVLNRLQQFTRACKEAETRINICVRINMRRVYFRKINT